MNPFRLIVPLLLLLSAYVVAARLPAIEGKVVRIVDGDTIDVLADRRQIRIRFYGIDAPERGQPFATAARRQIGDWIAGEQVTVEPVTRDRYRRIVGRVRCQGKDIGQELVRAGLAWWYRQHAPRDSVLQNLEAQARASRRGLWSQSAVPPWEWRK